MANTVNKVDPFGDGSGVALYQFDGSANDTGGNYNGTWHGTEQYNTGKFGQAAKFDGNSYVDATSIPKLITANAWSWSCWINTPDLTTHQIVCVNGRNLALGNGNSINRKNGNVYIYDNEITHIVKGSEDYEQTVKTIEASSYISVNKWHHFTYVYNGSNKHYVYINGNLVSELFATSSGDVELTDNIGFELFRHHYSDAANMYAIGLRDQVRIFNRALAEKEVAILYNEKIPSKSFARSNIF